MQKIFLPRPKTLKNVLAKNDLTVEEIPHKRENDTKVCQKSKCKLCKTISSTGTITNTKRGIKTTAENEEPVNPAI